ncbi:unnamed protein product [Orchesella dallaii]|uniref:CUB domain-containing protein n=1 Tax=Orchesella dallaii TaxID=48710 RepID=A0ABP1QFV0_9HEXA
MKLRISLFLAALAAPTTLISAQKLSEIPSEFDQETRCGATIEADSGTLIVPSSGQTIAPGSLCVFTIHLQTTATFRLNISSLNISGSQQEDLDCSAASVRIYSLTNLVPSDNIEGYTFCNDNPPPAGGSLFLSGNLATVIYQSSNESLGFTLNFEGIGFQPIPVTHESSYSSATSGLIRYPVEGEYEPNRVTTWLVKTSPSNPNLKLDVVIQTADFEECPNSTPENRCLCDALIIYEVSAIGQLTENQRVCGPTEEDLVLEGLSPNIIVAFFTDFIDIEGQGTGFEVLYRPSSNGTTTTSVPSTTTTPTPTTTPPRPPPSSNYTTECGGLLSGTQGLVEYKLGESVPRNERCIWTVRTPYRSRIKFSMIEPTTNDPDNNVRIYMVYSTGNLYEYTFPMHRPSEIIMNGTMAWVLFQSNSTGNGFAFSFTAEPDFDNSILFYEDFNEVVSDAAIAHHRFPESGPYRNLEMSTFVFMRPTDRPESQIEVNITSLLTETGEGSRCRDVIHVFRLLDYNSEDVFNPGAHITGLTPDAGICEITPSYPFYMKAHGILILFVSDQQGRSDGFELDVRLVG